ncbi:hypothetical protein KY285_033382 [Solanum tuberosum]|nr:hypothetical protein KY285_033382 [Solanum tuberosum]
MAEEHEIEEGEIYDDLVYSDLKIPKEERQVEEDYDVQRVLQLIKQKKSKVIQTEKKKSSRSKGEGKSTRRDTGIKDSAPKEREQQANKYRVKHQSEAESGMIRKPVYKKAIGYGKVARAYIAVIRSCFLLNLFI